MLNTLMNYLTLSRDVLPKTKTNSPVKTWANTREEADFNLRRERDRALAHLSHRFY